MDEKSLKPQLRFKGFADAWEQRKLADTSPLRGGYAFQSNKFEKDGVPVVKISNILPTGEVGGDFDCYNELPQDDNFVLPDGAAVLAMSGATTGKVSILNNPKKIKVYQNQRVGYFTQKKDVDYAFIKTLVKSNLFTDQLRSVLVAGAQPNVSSKDIDNFEFYFSKSIKEQSKIGGLFTNLDNLITLHQRKLDKLSNVKKALLEKMFPKNDSDVPEIRFKGFTDAWEQRKLEETVSFYSGLTYSPNNIVLQGGTLVLRSSNVKDGEIFLDDNVFVKKEIVNSDNVQEGDIIVVVRNGSRALIGKHAKIKKKMDNTVIGAFMTGVRYQQPDFLNSLLNTEKFNNEINKDLGATINQITTGSFKNMEFKFPVIQEEQQKIGAFFSNLDNLITLHQRKLEKLKNIKKACLEKMFV